MFCPRCKDEFRAGFTRCAACDVELVEQVSGFNAIDEDRQPVPPPPSPLRFVEYCGFLSLDEAREARGLLREARIRSEIVLRESPQATGDEPIEEEAWLRVDAASLAQVRKILPEPEVVSREEGQEQEPGTESAACGDCGAPVRPDATSCAACGARFEND